LRRLAVIGAGSWGTTLAVLLAAKGHAVNLYVRDAKLAEAMAGQHENNKYLPGVTIPAGVKFLTSLTQAVDAAELIALVLPSHGFREVATRLAAVLPANVPVVSMTKGIETDTLLRMSEVLHSVLPAGAHDRIAVMSGPNLAQEVSLGIPTGTVVASENKAVAEYIQDIFMTSMFRVYTHHDVVGVELGGALKNIIALGVGISDGLGFGDNTRATLITRGLTEIARLGQAMGAEIMTFAGLSGLGDLVCTCTSERSRNHQAGIRIGRGEPLAAILAGTDMVIEGVRSTQAAYRLAQKFGVEMPITEETYQVLYAGKCPQAAVKSLMGRERKVELEEAEMYRRKS